MTTSSTIVTIISAWILVDALILLFMYACRKNNKDDDDFWDEE